MLNKTAFNYLPKYLTDGLMLIANECNVFNIIVQTPNSFVPPLNSTAFLETVMRKETDVKRTKSTAPVLLYVS